MTIQNLASLARAYQSEYDYSPEILVVGRELPDAPYRTSKNWDSVLHLGHYQGSEVSLYTPHDWSYDEQRSTYRFHYEEAFGDGQETRRFCLPLPDQNIDRIIFLTPATDIQQVPADAELFSDDELIPAEVLATSS